MMKEIWMWGALINSVKLYEWKWCEKCNNSWYKGRIGIYEIISFSWKLKNLIRNKSTVEEIIEEARKWDLITMREDWILKAIKWHTTITEILRVI
jgi:type IV pilus assembly protein PilB